MTAPLTVGDVVLGRYRVERVLGQGGMGMVVAARHIALGELFAIKLMLVPDGIVNTQAVDRFLREARICASLKGEHVVKVQDVGQLEGGQPYMVLEYLEGQDLNEVLESRRALRITDVANVMLQACEALAEAHEQGIVHRDIKPANMFLIRKPNGKLSLKLLDFGISKRINSESKALTGAGSMLGSPLYMSPEQLADPRSVGPQSDIWAMGVVLYELVTGVPPFGGEVIGQVVQSILNGTPAPSSTHRPGLSAEVDRIVARCLEKNPRDRYATVQDLAMDIRALKYAPDVLAADASLPQLTVEIRAAGTNTDDIALGPTLANTPNENANESANPRAGRAVAAGSGANTNASVSTSVPQRGSSRSTLFTTLGIGAALLIVIGGLAMFALQTNSPPKPPTTASENNKPNAAVSPDTPNMSGAPIAPASTVVAPVEAPAAVVSTTTSVRVNTVDASKAPTTKSTSTVTATAPTIKAPPVTTATATTTTKKKREGLF